MRLAALTRKWIGTPFADTSCIGFVHDFLEEATGKDVPDAFGELTIANHFDRWRRDPEGVESALCEAVKAYTVASDPECPHLLDLLVVKIKGAGLTPAVYVGGGNAIAAFIKTGVSVFNLDQHNRAVVAGGLV